MANIEVFKSHDSFPIDDETYAPVEITPMDIDPSVKTEVDESSSAKVDPLQNESSPKIDVSASAEIVPLRLSRLARWTNLRKLSPLGLIFCFFLHL